MQMSVIFRRGIGIARTRLTNLEEGFPILTDQASKVIHGTISDILDIYHFYTAAHFIVDLPEFKNLHRQLAKDHCQQVVHYGRCNFVWALGLISRLSDDRFEKFKVF